MLIFKGCLVLGVIFSAVAFWSWRLRPDLTANNRAQQELEVAKAELEKILRRQTEIELTYASSEQEKIKAEKKLREIEVEISEALLDLDAAKNQLAEIENIAKRKETAVKALGSFK